MPGALIAPDDDSGDSGDREGSTEQDSLLGGTSTPGLRGPARPGSLENDGVERRTRTRGCGGAARWLVYLRELPYYTPLALLMLGLSMPMTGSASAAPCSSSFRRVHVHVHVRGGSKTSAEAAGEEIGLAPSALLSCSAVCLMRGSVPPRGALWLHVVGKHGIGTLSSPLACGSTPPRGSRVPGWHLLSVLVVPRP